MKSFSRVLCSSYCTSVIMVKGIIYWSISLKVLRCNGYNTKLQDYNLLNINVIRYYPNWGNTLFIYGS